ncbi:hypothetical protein T07_10526 [Trichinella nelsoni]|uniref:CCHC-type domain-containing protein n=1 Tax=Trichinella nelsoni TaxID=6336 RepID=A0A0V0SKI6_9BILA|nr:hypothetical protein T07_10526 [Trichinella nelsoni]
MEVAAREKRVWRELTTLKASVSSVKAVADQEDLQPSVEVTEAAATTKLLMTDIFAAAKTAPPQQRRQREKKDHRTCWTCRRTGHISRDCQASPRDYRTSKVSSTA